MKLCSIEKFGRLCSEYSLYSTFKRNSRKCLDRLSFPMLRAVLLSAQYVTDKGGPIIFRPTPEMVDSMKSQSFNPRNPVMPKKNKIFLRQNMGVLS
ncbi:hypothetical protein TSAR_002893 [Trichomalopsis sarcophagae]|uniref:Uncharacterized protein n=1 Tax=Trichomalopsis sarcophagae TaxID=543379 RepID=A0A232EG26_9HYME|nr:hypothetical protein TSAR_002893 [Trichomalopsis sarcophagae]